MEYYKKELDERFSILKGEVSENKMQFLGTSVFEFTTYDNSMDEYFAKIMIDVISVMINRTSSEYIKLSHENYVNYLVMVNIPFLADKIDWGTSIRSAWIEAEHMDFMNTIIEWVNE